MEGIYFGYFNLARRQQELKNQNKSNIISSISRSSINPQYSDSKINTTNTINTINTTNTINKSPTQSPTSSANSSSSSLNLKITEKTPLISNNLNEAKGTLTYNGAFNP